MLNPSDSTVEGGLLSDGTLKLPALLAGVSTSTYSATVKADAKQNKAKKGQQVHLILSRCILFVFNKLLLT